MKTSRPTMHSAPILAPVRTWARCQMLVPGPTATSGSGSARAWTGAEGSITGRSETPSGRSGNGGEYIARALASPGGPRRRRPGRVRLAMSTRDVGPRGSTAAATEAGSEDRRDHAEGCAEGERATPVQQGPDIAVDATSDEHEHAGRPCHVNVVRHERADDRLLDVGIAGQDGPDAALCDPD